MKKHALFMTVLLTLALTGLADARTYKIGVVPWMGWAPAHVAETKGFWQEQGVDVKVFNFPSNMATNQALKNHRIDIGFDMLGTAIGLYFEGVPVVIIAETDWSHGGDKIIVKRDADAAALTGKPVGVYLNQPSIAYFLNQYLAPRGSKIADVRLVQMETDSLADKFIAGLFNVIVSYDPDALRAEREGNGQVVATSATYAGCIPEGMLALQDNLQSIPAEDLHKILKGWVKAVEWTQNPANWPAYVEILNTSTFKGDAPYAEQDLRDMAAAVRIHDPAALLARNHDGGGLQQYLQDLRAFLAANNLLTKDFTPEEIVNNRAIIQALSMP